MVDGKVATKSGMMLGLGEKREEVCAAMDHMLDHDITVLTLGQYLRPSANHLPVVEYIHPDQFAEYKEIALQKGFKHVASGPLVRSSYHADDFRPELDIIGDAEAAVRPSLGLELNPEDLKIPSARPELVKASLQAND